jgi:type I restriction enzyme M protein
MLSNPPFGVEWKKIEEIIRAEYEKKGHHGRFGPGLPRISDGSLLFLLHMISKMRPVTEGGSRIGIVLNGSPLFTGGAGSGESEIRRYIIERDMLEAIVAFPTDMFYNTGISTYVWIVTNHKSPERKGKVQLVDGSNFFKKMRKALGSKRKELGEDDIGTITTLYDKFEQTETSKIFDNEDFGYSTITVERPLKLNFSVSPDRLGQLDGVTAFRKMGDTLDALKDALAGMGEEKVWKNRDAFLKDLKKALTKSDISLAPAQMKSLWQALSERDDSADVCTDSKGRPESDPDLRDTENVPLKENVQAYFEREVLPHVPDAWIDHDKTKVGYEIPFNRHFYKYVPPRPLPKIDGEMRALSSEIMELLAEVTA